MIKYIWNIIVTKNMLSMRSSIPPWLFNIDEKSSRLRSLLKWEKKISPINRKIDIVAERKISNFKKNNKDVDKTNEIIVPDHVFLGLIFGIINGPPIDLPKIYAVVSLKKEMNNII